MKKAEEKFAQSKSDLELKITTLEKTILTLQADLDSANASLKDGKSS